MSFSAACSSLGGNFAFTTAGLLDELEAAKASRSWHDPTGFLLATDLAQNHREPVSTWDSSGAMKRPPLSPRLVTLAKLSESPFKPPSTVNAVGTILTR